jgi:hypothetical protein
VYKRQALHIFFWRFIKPFGGFALRFVAAQAWVMDLFLSPLNLLSFILIVLASLC